MWAAVRFWLDLGVDGFRLDAIGTIYEDSALTPHNVPMELAQLRRTSQLAETPSEKIKVERDGREMFKHQLGQPGVHELMNELLAIMKGYD
jgi:alpha-glucosidase